MFSHITGVVELKLLSRVRSSPELTRILNTNYPLISIKKAIQLSVFVRTGHVFQLGYTGIALTFFEGADSKPDRIIISSANDKVVDYILGDANYLTFEQEHKAAIQKLIDGLRTSHED